MKWIRLDGRVPIKFSTPYARVRSTHENLEHFDSGRIIEGYYCGNGEKFPLYDVEWLDETSSEEPDQVEIWTEIKKMLWEGTLHDYISTEGIEQLKSKYTITRK